MALAPLKPESRPASTLSSLPAASSLFQKVVPEPLRQALLRLAASVTATPACGPPTPRLKPTDAALLVRLVCSVSRPTAGLLRATLRAAVDAPGDTPEAPAVNSGIRFDSSLAFGCVFALDRLWHELGFDEIAGLLRPARLSFDAEALVRAKVFNRLCDATSKLGLLRWLQTTWLPGVDPAELTHQRLLRTMDALQAQADALASRVSRLLRPLIDQRLSVVFYDLTTLRAEGLSEQPGDLRRFGLAKEGIIARQCLLSAVQTAEGLPISHRVWGGNVAETATLASAIAEITRNYPVQRIILVADRGLLSVDNLAMLDGLKVGDQPLVSVSSQFDVPMITLVNGRLAAPCTPWGFAPNPTLAGRQLGHGGPHAQAAASVRKAPRYQGVGFAPVLARSVLARRCRAALRCGLRAGP